MRRRIISVFIIIIYMNIALHTYAAAFSWSGWAPLGKPILVYDNDTLLYNLSLDIDSRSGHTYAILAGDGVYDIFWQTLQLGNFSIISTRNNATNRSAYIIIDAPGYNVTLTWLLEEQENQTPENQTNETPTNQTGQNNQTTSTPTNQTNSTSTNTTNSMNTTAPTNSTNQNQSQENQSSVQPQNGTQNRTSNTTIQAPKNLTCNSVEECQQIIANLTAQLEQLKKERQELIKQIEYLKQQQNLTMTENEQLKKQIKILEKALKEKNEEIARLQEQIAELQKQQWSWKTFKEKSEDQYILWTPWIFPVVLAGLVVSYRRYKKMRKYMDVQIDVKAKELKEELLSEYLKKDLLKAKIETLVDDPNLLVILRTIIPQLTGSQEITKGDILELDIDQVLELARKKFLLKENRVEYLKKKLLELKEKIREEAGGNV